MDAQTTAQQNQVVAMNSVARATLYLAGTTTSTTYTGPDTIQILSGPGRLTHVCVVIKGSGTVSFYDSPSVNTTPDNALLYIIAANADAGIVPIGLEVSDGIVVVIGSGVTINVTYSAARG